ncbi:LysM peptidoglycan-binding domain-containing protein [Desulfococcaceae bacterium HSG9]|nr:LysM peptidoglycan-binding domain-containing protein [Desulfococcaceae bacterium HSG9]
MSKKNEYEPGDIKIEEREAHYEQEDDLAWRNNRGSKSFPRALRKSPLSVIAIAVGVLAMIIICLFLIIPWKSDNEEPIESTTLPDQYTDRQDELIEINQRLKTLDTKYQNIELFKKRLDDLEESLALRLNLMEKKLTDIQTSFKNGKIKITKEAASTASTSDPPPQEVISRATAPPKPTPVSTPKPVLTPKPTLIPKPALIPKPVLTSKPEIKAPPQKFSRKHYHKVSANETLFSISRRYKMKIDELLALNKMNKNDKIQIGQILIVNLSEGN